MVTPNYFRALGIRIVRGRGFTDEDRAPTANPVILSEALADKLFSPEDPIGRQLRFFSFDRQGPWRTVVGVAANVKNNGLVAPADPEFYIPWKNDPETYVRRAHVTFRASLSPEAVVPWIRTEITGLDPTAPVEFATMETRIGRGRLNGLRAWLRRVVGVFRRERLDAELAAELESHVQMRTEGNVRAGMTPEAARRSALILRELIELRQSAPVAGTQLGLFDSAKSATPFAQRDQFGAGRHRLR
jgi:hypothetical protein